MRDQDLLQELISIQKGLPKKQVKVCDYLIENYQDISVLSIAELSKRIGVGTTTVMRFIYNAGYESYNELKKQFHYYSVQSSKPTWWHLEKSLTNEQQTGEKTIEKTWNETIKVLNQSLGQHLIEQFDKAVEMILKADSVNILGLRTSKAIAYYFEMLLSEFYPKTRQISHDSEFIYDRVMNLDKKDVLILFAFSPYTTKTIETAEYCYQQGIPVILVTNHLSCPASRYAQVILQVKPSEQQYSITPGITLIEALVIEIGQKTSNQSIQHLNKLNAVLSEKHVTQT